MSISQENNAKYLINKIKGFQVIIIGGDGTINEAIDGYTDKIELIYIPSGSGNDLGKSLSITTDVYNIKNILMSNYFEEYDIGVVNGRKFCSGFDIGFNSDILKRANNSRFKKYFKSNIYKISGIITLFRLKKYCVEYKIDEKKIKTNKLLMFNIMVQPYEGGGIKFAPKASGRDGKLYVMIMRDIGILKFIYNYLCILLNKHRLLKGVELYETDKVEILTTQEYYQIDGEIVQNKEKLTITCVNSFYKIKKRNDKV